ncbi:MAG: hypothetical protein TU36_003765 [Vulcanisaeta sp. AZ3]
MEIINRVSKLRDELYRLRTMLNDIERRTRRRHDLITGIYEELMNNPLAK